MRSNALRSAFDADHQQHTDPPRTGSDDPDDRANPEDRSALSGDGAAPQVLARRPYICVCVDPPAA